MTGQGRKLALLPIALVVLSAFAACTDESIVYRDRELFEDPLPAAMSFLGYTSIEDTLTVCGNCHVGPQKEWIGTAHAGAWDGLQNSGSAAEYCEGCHTVNQLGNSVTETAGYLATGEERYYDVQCESCHGPGLTHVNDPSDATVPLASMSIAHDSLGVDATAAGCAQCHTGSHHPYAEQWVESKHATVNAYPAGREECQSCHTGEGALAAFGVNTVYAEMDDVAAGDHLEITCAVCHDPHGSDNSAQLRFPIDAASEDQNLCMKCHHKRGVPDPTTFRGPHSPEGPTILGTAGWWPPDLQQPILSTHGSATENPRLCAGCHVNSYDVTDDETGEFVISATGHTFEATPCVDASGVPTGGECADSAKSYAACVDCHSEAVAEGLVESAKASIEDDIATLDSLLALVDPGEFDDADDRYTVGEGAQFNLDLAETSGAVIHNAFLIRALLDASIAEVKDRYGL